MITSEIIEAYTQCKLKAYRILCSKKIGIRHEYISIIEEYTKENKIKYLHKVQMETPDAELFSPGKLRTGLTMKIKSVLTKAIEYEN